VPCFEAPAGGEVVVAGRKLIGSAARAHGGAILQHGATLLDWDSDLQAGAMGLDDDSLRLRITTFAEQMGGPTDRSMLEKTLVKAFSAELRVRFQEEELTASEREREQRLHNVFARLE